MLPSRISCVLPVTDNTFISMSLFLISIIRISSSSIFVLSAIIITASPSLLRLILIISVSEGELAISSARLIASLSVLALI